MDVLYIVMPAYNEEKNIENVIKDWHKNLNFADKNSKIIIADSGSEDSTSDIIMKLQKTLGNIVVLNGTKKEHGPKLIALYKYAIEQNADFIFQTDSDGQTNAKEFKKFWEIRNEYCAIIGNRSTRKDGLLRILVENIVCIILRIIFNVKIPDANAPFRLMQSQLVKRYINNLPYDYSIPNVMLTTFFSYYDEKICFKKISFNSRCGGKNSINIIKIVKIGIKAIGEFISFKKKMR